VRAVVVSRWVRSVGLVRHQALRSPASVGGVMRATVAPWWVRWAARRLAAAVPGWSLSKATR
jgi:hypothetical protein